MHTNKHTYMQPYAHKQAHNLLIFCMSIGACTDRTSSL